MSDDRLTTEELAAAAEASGKVQLEPDVPKGPIEATGTEREGDAFEAELAEMRVISKRLKALPPEGRKRVLAWLTSRFA